MTARDKSRLPRREETEGAEPAPRPTVRAPHAAAVALATVMLAATPALAQWSRMFPDDVALTSEDIAAMRGAREQLLAIDPPALGRTMSWSNPRSGVQGTILMESAFETRGMPCRRLRYVITPPGKSSTIDVTQQICRVADGSWKFL